MSRLLTALVLALDSGVCGDVEAGKTLKAKVWRPSHKDFVYPETKLEHLQDRESFGIAIAGGGLRGMALAHGAVRTLKKAGMLDRAKYLSLTSGSIWFGVPFYYQTQDSLDEFLGEYIPPDLATPEKLISENAGTMITRMMWPITEYPQHFHAPKQESSKNRTLATEELVRQHPTLARVLELLPKEVGECFDSPCKCRVEGLIPDMHEIWTIITMILLHPFKVLKPNGIHTHQSQLQHVADQLGTDNIILAQDVKNELPFLVTQSAVIALESGTDQAEDPLIAFPYENTPLYSGVPIAITGSALGREQFGGLGDVLVEPFASYSEALEMVRKDAESEVSVRRMPQFLNFGDLGDWQGAATCYPADWQIRPHVVSVTKRFPCLATFGEKFLPHGSLWSPLDTDSKGVPIARKLPVADAGIYDDIGHLPLLRRGVKKIVIMESSAVHDDSSGTEEANIEEMVYLKAAWGHASSLPDKYPDGSPNPMMAKDYLTVFEPSEFPPLWEKLKKQRAMGEPCVVRGTFTVVDNPHWGIKGGWKVDMVVVVALPSKLYRSQLPVETGTALPHYFPNVISSEFKSQMELSALSQYSSWLYRHFVMKEIRAMLDGKSPEPEAWV
jgi:hypothetical protein